MLRGRFIAIQVHLKKQAKSQINNLTLHLKQLEKEEMKNPRASRRKEILKIGAEINTKETEDTIAKISKTKSWFFKKLNNQGDNVQPWCIPFPIWNQSVVPCPVLTVVSYDPLYFCVVCCDLSIFISNFVDFSPFVSWWVWLKVCQLYLSSQRINFWLCWFFFVWSVLLLLHLFLP